MDKLFFLFEVLSLATSLIFFNIIRKSFFIILVPFLLLTVLFEYGSFSGWFIIKKSNLWSANIFTTFEFVFYLLLISFFHTPRRIKTWICISAVVLLIVFALNITKGQGFWNLNTYTIIFGSLLIIWWCCYTFYKVINTDAELNLITYSIFWISTGLFIFYLTQFAFMMYFNYMLHSKTYQYAQLFKTILTTSNIVLYSCIAIGIICCKYPITKL